MYQPIFLTSENSRHGSVTPALAFLVGSLQWVGRILSVPNNQIAHAIWFFFD
jgi:hypothetical protein